MQNVQQVGTPDSSVCVNNSMSTVGATYPDSFKNLCALTYWKERNFPSMTRRKEKNISPLHRGSQLFTKLYFGLLANLVI